MVTVTMETTHNIAHNGILNAPASVLTLNESSVDGFRSNFFSILRIELIVMKTAAERAFLLENQQANRNGPIFGEWQTNTENTRSLAQQLL